MNGREESSDGCHCHEGMACGSDSCSRGSDDETQLQKLFVETGALLSGHFLLTSGLHSGSYMQCALLLRYPEHAAFAGVRLARALAHLKPDLVAAPALGGLLIGHEVARALGVPFLFCEREEGRMVLRRFSHPGKVRVVVVEDVVTTGGSLREVGEHFAQGGADWVGSGCIVDRSAGRAAFPHSLTSLLRVSFPVYEPASCPLCVQGLPLVKPGSRTGKR
jgi:orotate phosphoribosyltransferase